MHIYADSLAYSYCMHVCYKLLILLICIHTVTAYVYLQQKITVSMQASRTSIRKIRCHTVKGSHYACCFKLVWLCNSDRFEHVSPEKTTTCCLLFMTKVKLIVNYAYNMQVYTAKATTPSFSNLQS